MHDRASAPNLDIGAISTLEIVTRFPLPILFENASTALPDCDNQTPSVAIR
jgi:hypothetical protein